jgi:formamidopyrimidine-DNA glycosylase
MPELPEVEIVVRGLDALIKAQPCLVKIIFNRNNLREPFPQSELQKFVGQKILSVKRRGKYILFNFEKGTAISHLGMSGTWRDGSIIIRTAMQAHDHIVLKFSNGQELIYNDPRRFGYFGTSVNEKLNDLGPEPLSDDFDSKYLFSLSRNRSVPIKSFIMDAKVVVGVGNIYASESLFHAKINPNKKVSRISLREASDLVRSIKSILAKAIKQGGSSISDYRQTNGQSGNFQNHFFVYDRKGLACNKCGFIIKAKMISGRNSFWCPSCQK